MNGKGDTALRAVPFAAGFILVSTMCAYAQVRWPLAAQDATHPLWHGYGTFTDLGGDHFHEGIDIPVADASAPNVLAAEAGTIVEVVDNGTNDDLLTVSRAGDNTTGWGYVHITVGVNPATTMTWATGDAVAQGDVLGTVRDHTVFMDHLHFEAVNDDNGGWPNAGGGTPDLQGDPIDFLDPNTDDVPPTILKDNGGHFYYREGGNEGMANADYFAEMLDNRIVISDNVDIIVRAYDVFGNHDGVDYHVGVKKIQFAVTGPGNIATQVLEDFSGLFLTAEAPVGRNAFDEFRDDDRTHTIYEDDNTATSRGHSAGAGGVSTNLGEYYYILTNKDDDDNNELADADRYWDTDGRQGEPWNDDREDPAHEAPNNANDAFPDGFYTVGVTAFSLGSSGSRFTSSGAPLSTTVDDDVYVNNFSQTIIPDKSIYAPGEPVFVTGNQYEASTPYTAYLIKDTDWPDHAAIPHGAIVTTTPVVSDVNGNIPLTQIWSAYAPNGDPDAGYDIVVDYDGDDLYHLPRNGFTIDALNHISSVAGPDGAVPTATTWGCVVMLLLVLVAGTAVIRRRCPARA